MSYMCCVVRIFKRFKKISKLMTCASVMQQIIRIAAGIAAIIVNYKSTR